MLKDRGVKNTSSGAVKLLDVSATNFKIGNSALRASTEEAAAVGALVVAGDDVVVVESQEQEHSQPDCCDKRSSLVLKTKDCSRTLITPDIDFISISTKASGYFSYKWLTNLLISVSSFSKRTEEYRKKKKKNFNEIFFY